MYWLHQANWPIRSRRFAIMAAVLAIVLVLYLFHSRSNYVTVAPPELCGDLTGLRPVTLQVSSGSEKISREFGHSHGPFGVIGSGRYCFDGKIQFDGHIVRLESGSFAPCAVFETSGFYYILLIHGQNRVDFELRRWDRETGISPIAPTNSPQQLRKLGFVDRRLNFAYKVWMLNSFSEIAAWEDVRGLIAASLSQDSRSFCLEGTRDVGMYTVRFQTLVQQICIPSNSNWAEVVFRQILRESRPGDNFNTIGELIQGVLSLNPVEGRDWICQYKLWLIDMGLENDNRLRASTGFGIPLRKFDCNIN